MKAVHRSTSSKETSSCSLPQRGTTYRRWNSESMEKAVKVVELGMPIRQACEIFSVPKSSLHDRVSDKVDYKARSGPTPYLYYQHRAQNQVIIFTFPPHPVHVMQPLDRGCFAPLKVSWRQICHQFIAKNPGKTVSQYDFVNFSLRLGRKLFQ